jgi:hypothetical protein
MFARCWLVCIPARLSAVAANRGLLSKHGFISHKQLPAGYLVLFADRTECKNQLSLPVNKTARTALPGVQAPIIDISHEISRVSCNLHTFSIPSPLSRWPSMRVKDITSSYVRSGLGRSPWPDEMETWTLSWPRWRRRKVALQRTGDNKWGLFSTVKMETPSRPPP